MGEPESARFRLKFEDDDRAGRQRDRQLVARQRGPGDWDRFYRFPSARLAPIQRCPPRVQARGQARCVGACLDARTAGRFSRRRFKNASCSAEVILFSNLLVVLRQRRDAAIASKSFVFVAMNEKGWRYYAHRRVPLQEIHGIKTRFTPEVG